MPPDTVLVLIARGKPPKGLAKAVEARRAARCATTRRPSRGRCRSGSSPRRAAQGLRLGLGGRQGPDRHRGQRPAAAGAGDREAGDRACTPRPRRAARTSSATAAGDAAPKVYDLADAVVAGDVEATLALAEELARPRRAPEPPRLPGRRPPARGARRHRAARVAGWPRRTWPAQHEGAAVAGEEGGGAGPARPTARRWSGPSAASPTSSSSCAAAAPSTRTRRSRWRWPAPRPDRDPGQRAVGVPPLLGADLRLDVHVLGLLEGLESLLAQLAPQARLLEAAERPGVVVGQRVVDPDGART